MAPAVVAQMVLAAFVFWVLLVAVLVARTGSPRWLRWFIVLPFALFLTRNPFGSGVDAAIFLVLVWALAVMFALAFPMLWWFGQLGRTAELVSVMMLALPFVLKRAAPDNRWIGVAVALVFGPWGHWYREGGGPWVAGLWAATFLAGLVWQLAWIQWHAASAGPLLELPKVWLGWPGASVHLASAVSMYFRFKNEHGHVPAAFAHAD